MSRAGPRGVAPMAAATAPAGDPAVIGSHDFSGRTFGFAAGLDYHLTPDTVVGFALAGAGTDWSLSQGLGGGKSDAFQAGVYGATRSGPAYLAAAFAFANHWMSTDRVAVGDHLTANFNAPELWRAAGGRLPSWDALWRHHALRRHPGTELPHAELQRDRRHRQRFCARLRLARRDRYQERTGCALRPGCGAQSRRRADTTRAARLGA